MPAIIQSSDSIIRPSLSSSLAICPAFLALEGSNEYCFNCSISLLACNNLDSDSRLKPRHNSKIEMLVAANCSPRVSTSLAFSLAPLLFRNKSIRKEVSKIMPVTSVCVLPDAVNVRVPAELVVLHAFLPLLLVFLQIQQ